MAKTLGKRHRVQNRDSILFPEWMSVKFYMSRWSDHRCSFFSQHSAKHLIIKSLMKTVIEQVNPMGSFSDTEGLLQHLTELVPDWIERKLNIGALPTW